MSCINAANPQRKKTFQNGLRKIPQQTTELGFEEGSLDRKTAEIPDGRKCLSQVTEKSEHFAYNGVTRRLMFIKSKS